MDPNETLRQIECTEYRSEEFELTIALNDWLRKGGFQPDWDKYKYGTRYYKEHCKNLDLNPLIKEPEPVADTGVLNNPVDHPSHYNQSSIECIDAMEAMLSPEEFRGFLRGNSFKYRWRYRDKNGVEDLKKAMWYEERLLKLESNQ